MKFSWRTELPPLLLLLATLALSAWAWPRLPDEIPVHWGLDGRPDRWGGRAEGLMITPAVGLFLYLLFSAFPWLDPGRANYASFGGTYFRIRLAVIVFIAAVHAVVIGLLLNARTDVTTWVMPLVGALLFFIGSQIDQLAPNWFMGVRTPWTLSSPSTWKRTNRMGGIVLRIGGVLFAVAGFAHRLWVCWVAIGAMAVGVLFVVIYSYLVWKDAPDKTPPGGTTTANS